MAPGDNSELLHVVNSGAACYFISLTASSENSLKADIMTCDHGRDKEEFFSVDPITTDTAVVTVGEYLDFRNASDFNVILKDHVRQGTRKFILDFSDTTSFDSTGLGSLFTLYRQLAPLSGMICFASTSDVVRYAVQVTRSYKVFSQYPTVEAARKAVCALER